MYHRRIAHLQTDPRPLEYENGIIHWTGQKQCMCEVCIVAKGQRAPIPREPSTTVVTQVGELTHTDTKTLKLKSIVWALYEVVCVDAYSEFVMTYRMRSLNQTQEKLGEYRTFMNTHGHVLRRFRSDNGSEFFNKKMYA